MRKLVFAFAVSALVASSLVTASDRWSDETERISRTLPLEPGGTLRLKSFSGRVTINPSDRSEVVIDAVRRASRERLSRITLDIHAEGSRVVVIDADHRERSWFMFTGNNVVETDFDIKVPRRTNLDVSVFSAAVSVDGIEGSHKLNGFSSRVSLIDVSGPIRAHSFSGSFLIRTKTWPDDESIDVDTFSGNIELHLPESARGRVTFNSFSGRLNSEMPLTLHSSGRRSLTADLGGGGDAQLSFKTFSGSVRIDR